jgi:tetratricopeptide (TPR) repeat protein
LLVTVARAVHHAHQRGILHRDLKPANILIDEHGQPHVTDFGLAKRVQEDSGITHTGEIMGTPAYMAPEQARGLRGLVTTASDVYGLGGILYSLLTGRPPFRGDSVMDTLEQVRDRAVEPPSRVNRRVPRDLEVICLKCLEKEPSVRYASAEALARDLERWTRGEPIDARPVGPISRVAMWARRRPVPAGLAAALLLATIAGASGVTLNWLRARALASQLFAANQSINKQVERAERALEIAQERRAEAERERAEAERERALAEENFRLARKAVDDQFTKVSENRLLLEPGMQPLRQDLLRSALSYYLKFLQARKDDPELKVELASTYQRVAAITSAIGSDAEAIAAYESAVAIRESLVLDPLAPIARRIELGESLDSLGMAYRSVNRLDAARSAFERALAIRREVAQRWPGPRASRTLDGRVSRWLSSYVDQGTPGQHEAAVALTLAHLAGLRLATGELAQGRTEYREARAIRERLVADYPEVPTHRMALAQTMLDAESFSEENGSNLALPLIAQFLKGVRAEDAGNRREEFEALRELATNPILAQAMAQQRFGPKPAPEVEASLIRVAEHMDRALKLNPSLIEVRANRASIRFALGSYYLQTGQPDRAFEPYRVSLDDYETLARQHPSVSDYRVEQARIHERLAEAWSETGRKPEAEESYQRSARIFEEVGPLRPADGALQQERASAQSRLGHRARDSGRPEEAITHYRAALEIREKLAKAGQDDFANQAEIAWIHYSIGRTHYNAGEPDQALESHRRARALCEAQLREKPDDLDRVKNLSWTLMGMGHVHRDNNQPAEAHASYARAIPFAERLVREHPDDRVDQSDRAWTWHNLGSQLLKANRVEEAVDATARAVPASEEFLERWPMDDEARHVLAHVLADRAEALERAGRPAESLRPIDRSIELMTPLAAAWPGNDDFAYDLAHARFVSGSTRALLGQTDAAEALRAAAAACVRIPETRQPGKADLMEKVGALILNAGRPGEALPLFEAAVVVRRARADDAPTATRNSVLLLGRALAESGRAAEAEPLIREVLEARRNTLPAGDWSIANTESILGDCLTRLRRFDEAEPLLRSGVDKLEAAQPARPVPLRRALERMVAHQEARGRDAEAKFWRDRWLDANFPKSPFAR